MKLNRKQKKKLFRILLALLFFAVAICIDSLVSLPWYASLLLFVPSYLTVGLSVLISAVSEIGRGRVFSETFLMALATLGAFAISEYAEATMVMVFFSVGELFESCAASGARNAIKKLAVSCPDTVSVIRGGEMLRLPVEEIEVGECVCLVAGERASLDAVITEGGAFFDTSMMTGESMPVYLEKGDTVIGGYMCTDAPCTLSVIRKSSESGSARIISLMEDAATKKASIEGFISRFSLYYTPIVVLLAVAIAFLPPILWSLDIADFVYRALSFLVVSCPCALVISVPLTYFCAVGRAASLGIIFKSNNALEKLSRTRVCALDKTGTLTNGEFIIEDIHPIASDKEELLKIAASLECFSSHPLARAVMRSAEGIPLYTVTDVKEKRGKGISGVISGKRAVCGSAAYALEDICDADSSLDSSALSSAVFVVYDGVYLGYISLCDSIKKGARKIASELSKMKIDCIMLTGDNENAARAVAEELGIKSFRAGLLPEDKLIAAEELREKGVLLYAGDGINDAPIMALSDVGMAMGGIGSDIVTEAADAVISDDDPEKIVFSVRLAKKADRIVKQNVIFAIGVKVAVLILSSLGIAGLPLAIFADVGVSVIAILNSIRVRFIK